MNTTSHPPGIATYKNITSYSSTNTNMFIFEIFTMIFSVLGMLGNGLVIWLLGSSIKRNTFAIYILNLSVADFGLLIINLIIEICLFVSYLNCDLHNMFFYELLETVLLLMYTTGQFLLMVISIDRCISVFFPIWYRYHRPVHLFTIICAVIWAISFLISSIYFKIMSAGKVENYYILMFPFIINVVFCLPLMTISSVFLFIKICVISKGQRQRKLLIAVLLNLFFFLVLALPLNVICLTYHVLPITNNIVSYGYLCICINSSINPLIYYLVGRFKAETQRSIKDLFQRVFKEEENCTEQMETSGGSKI